MKIARLIAALLAVVVFTAVVPMSGTARTNHVANGDGGKTGVGG